MTLQTKLKIKLAQDLEKNCKNGNTSKIMKSQGRIFELDTSRDRNGSFKLGLVEKNQTHISDELESKILSLHWAMVIHK